MDDPLDFYDQLTIIHFRSVEESSGLKERNIKGKPASQFKIYGLQETIYLTRQRKIMTPAFTPQAIRAVINVFYDSAYKVVY
jgi:cytochrome P450